MEANIIVRLWGLSSGYQIHWEKLDCAMYINIGKSNPWKPICLNGSKVLLVFKKIDYTFWNSNNFGMTLESYSVIDYENYSIN